MRRLVVKLGSNILTGTRDVLSVDAMRRLVDQVATLHNDGVEVVIVSSGAVAAARARFPDLRRRPDLPAKQMLAAIGQVRLMHLYDRLLARQGIAVAQALLARGDLSTRQGYLNARSTLLGLLRHRVLPIINENDVVATDEIKFGDNDTLSAIVAGLVDADLLLILTDIDGLFTVDPRQDPRATLIREVPMLTPQVERLAGGSGSMHGTGGMLTKVRAARLAIEGGIPMVIANGTVQNALARAIAGEIGTRFLAGPDGLDARRRWLRAHLAGRGEIMVDDGAAAALRYKGRSLLPAGVVAARGRFDRGDAVEVRDRRSQVVGFGLSNYSAAAIERLVGAHSSAIATLLGYHHGDEIIHRDNLVIVPPEDEEEQRAAHSWYPSDCR
ncbi:MAG TPA: glutamate 5-kinase [Chloroflexota bacterium]|nr:glutamate 5-kinase [Chloroflexota bacterium]